MEILIISININWVYRLYEEYLISLQYFISKYYTNHNINIIFFETSELNIENIDSINFENYDKIFYSGDFDMLNYILKKLKYNYNKIYFINIEQMSHVSYYRMISTLDNNLNVIDYSEENIKYLEKIFNSVYLFSPFFENNIIDIKKKNIDLLSINNNEYRNNIIKTIKIDKKFNFLLLDNCYGSSRDDYFDKTKIYLNIHCSDNHLTMELIRIVNLIMRKVIIISQPTIYKELLFFNKYIIICNDQSNFKLYIEEILNNYDKYYNKIYGNFNENEYILYIKNNLNKLFM
jgi:hypothetical protein